MDFYSFYIGQEFEAYKYLGAHFNGDVCVFRNFAPQANKVELLFKDRVIPMNKIYDGNFYEAVVSDATEGDAYEYRIYGNDGSVVEHMDPYGFGMELRPNHKSIVRNLKSFAFSDSAWMKSRGDMKDKPLNIYEVHAGSWKKKGSGDTDWYNYKELAELLIPYMKSSYYNYVEFLPLCEHPADISWGYQNTGYFSPTSRYGSADDLKEAINMFHNNGIGVILDFVPAHFALDCYGLKKYDGTHLYEYPSDDVGVSEWGSCNFMHSRGEVRSYLQSSVNYWLKEFHFDGIRMDAVSRLIYWQGDEHRGENKNAIDFLKFMNSGIKKRNPGIMLIAEDSTNYPGVTESVEKGGLGFDYKWALGWMHDTLQYFQSPAYLRTEIYHKLTFSMMYFRNENYMLPFSHDEVVHGKATILQKMNGDYDIKFPQARAMYMYMMVHPGKKLNFMGNEFGQFREWDEKREQDWELFKFPMHDSFCRYIKELNKIYIENDAFWSMDYEQEGFRWLDCHCEERCIYSIIRIGKKEKIAAVFNFGDKKQEDYEVYISELENPTVALYSDWQEFSGSTKKEDSIINYEGNKLFVSIKPYSGILIKL